VAGTEDDAVFSDVKMIPATLEGVGLSDEDRGVLAGLLEEERLGVRSDYFSGVVRAGIATGGVTAEIRFTCDRAGRFYDWRE